HASGRMSPQRHDDNRAVSIKIQAFVKNLIGARLEFQGWSVNGRKPCGVRRYHEAFGLRARIECELQFFRCQQNRKTRQVHESACVVEMRMRKDHPANLGGIFSNQPEELAKRYVRVQLPGKTSQFEAQGKGVRADLVVKMGRV